MTKGKKMIVKNVIEGTTCPICGYTCKNFKDLKFIQKIVRLHMTKEHGFTEFTEHNSATTCNPEKNETLLSTLTKLRQECEFEMRI